MNIYIKTIDNNWFRYRLTIIMLWIFLAFAVLFIRLFYIQVLQGNEFYRLSENNCIRLHSINAPRGFIYDRDGELLVDNRPSFDLNIILKDAKPLEPTVHKLSNYLGVSRDILTQKLKESKKISSYKQILLKEDIGREALAAIEVHKFDLPGVIVNVKALREYIYRESASHLIGYLSEINPEELKKEEYLGCHSGDYIGRYGTEKTFESFLRGRRGGRQVEVNAAGQIVRILNTVDAEPGNNVYLTVYHELQKRAETLLEGTAGAIVAMEPSTGQILAMASSPSYDQNIFVGGLSHVEWNSLKTNPFRPMENKAIQGEYPPASTYKILTALAGLEEGAIDEQTTFFCPGHYKFGNRIYRCWKKGGHGRMNVVDALTQSCDVFFYQVGQKLGVDQLASYATACGLGKKTSVNLDHEAAGLIPTSVWKKRRTGIAWQRGETLSVAIGQGYNLVTPIQLANMIASFANGGTIYKPKILDKIETASGETVYQSKPEIVGKMPFNKRTAAIVKKGLWEVVNGSRGTARMARLNGVEISGKTGTAQVFSRKKNESAYDEINALHLKAHAWFVAYAPSIEPRIAIAVIIEHGEHGSSAASPIAKELVRTYLEIE